MAFKLGCALTVALALVLVVETAAQAPESSSETQAAQTDDSREAERQKVLESDRWREMQRHLDEWLSVQQIYSPEEVSALRAEVGDRVASMTPDELASFLADMEERLTVLMSADAEEARQWIAQIVAVARNPESQLGGPLPDVANMTASQIREEIQRFQQRRASRQQAQSAFDLSRQNQVQSARDVQAARREVLSQPRTAATFVEPSYQSPYAPRRTPRRAITGPPIYRIGPWGEPIFWSPLNDWHPWRSSW